MSPLLTLVKILASLYQVRRIKDKQLETEILDIYSTVETMKGDLFTQDKKIETAIRDTIKWIQDQPADEPVIKSILMQRVMDFTKDAPELNKSIEYGLEDYPAEERTRQIIYRHMKEIRNSQEDDKFNKEFKDNVKEAYFGNPSKLTKDQWVKLADMIEHRVNSAYLDNRDTSLVESVDTDTPNAFVSIIERAHDESSEKGIISLGLQGMNRALAPDFGLKRGKMYMTPALTNRGKSFNIGHMLAAVGLYNTAKDKLRDKTKIPTVVLDSAEDALDIIIERMYRLVMVNEFGHQGDFKNEKPIEIANTIIRAFSKNGWFLKINRINPTEDNYYNLCDRVRKMEMSGHEIIVYFYDYLAMMDLKGMTGETKGDKLQDLYRRSRTFMATRGIAWVTPHQLSPEAKKQLRESDDDSELNFAKEVAGKSMTETSTKLTNEVDVELTIHVAKTDDDKAYFTFMVGKFRGEGAPLSDRFGVYNIDPVLGLMHDFGKKNACRKSFKHILDESGNSVPDFDYMGE